MFVAYITKLTKQYGARGRASRKGAVGTRSIKAHRVLQCVKVRRKCSHPPVHPISRVGVVVWKKVGQGSAPSGRREFFALLYESFGLGGVAEKQHLKVTKLINSYVSI